MSGNFIYRHHVEPRVKLYSPREESFPIPLKYIDVSRTTHTNLDVKQEKRINDYWNIDGSRDLSDPWTGFTQFTLLEEKPPEGYMWSGRRLTRKQQTSRPDHLWPELWRGMSKNTKLREKQKWSNEKLHLENARKLQFKETIKNARKKLETPMVSVREDFQRIMGQTNNDCRFRILISTNSLHQQHLLVGRYDSRLRYVLAHNFLRKLCYGSKKCRMLIQWMISNLRAL